MAARKPAKIAGLAVFECPSRPGHLLLTPSTCAASHKMAQGAQEEAKVRLWECIDCKVGAKHLAELGIKPTRTPCKRSSDLTEQMRNLLRLNQARGRVTVSQAAEHFGRLRGPVYLHMVALEKRGLTRRIVRGSAPIEWEVAL